MPITIPPEIPQYDEYGRRINLPAQQMPNYSLANPAMPPVIPQAQQMPAPDFTRIPISPVVAMPAESRLAGMAPLNINDPQYENSRLRTVLNAIAGGFAGAAGGPKVGMEVGSSLRDAKYNRAVQAQQGQIDLLKPQVASETERRRVGEEEVKAGIQKGTAQSLDVTRRSTADKKKQEADTKAENVNSQVARRSSLTSQGQQKLDKMDKDLQEAIDWSKLPPEEHDKFLKSLEEINTAKNKGKETTAEKTQAKIDIEAKPENVEKIKTVSAARGASSAEGHAVGAGTPAAVSAEERSSEAKAKGTAHGRLEELSSEFGIKAQTEIAKSLAEGRSLGNTLTSNIKETMEAAKHGLSHMPRIYGQIDHMEKDGKLGPIMSKWSDFMAGKVGTDYEAGRLRFNIGLMDTLLAKAHGGARGGGSPAMMQHFASLLSSKNMDANTLRTTLKEAEIWLTEYAKHPEYNSPIGNASARPPIKLNGVEVK